MTTGRAIVKLSAWRLQVACSSTSARSLSTSTVARLTVQTLIGSYEALRTRTRPFVPPRCACRPSSSAGWCPGASSPRAGSTGCSAVAVTPFSVYKRGPAGLPSSAGGDGGGVRPQHAQHLHTRAQGVERAGYRLIARRALEVGEEHVVPDRRPARPRLDLGQVDLTLGELAQHPHERPRRAVVEAPEHQRRL